MSVAGLRIVVFNPLPWPRQGAVDFAFPFMGSIAGKTAVKSVDDGEIQALQTWGADSHRNGRFVAKNVPPLGYKTYMVTGDRPKETSLAGNAKSASIENRWLKVTFDPARGCIASIIDKATGAELVDQKSPHGFGQYLYQQFSRQECDDYIQSYILPPYRGSHGRITGKSTYVPDSARHLDFSPANLNLEVAKNGFSITGTLVPPMPACETAHTAGLTATLYEDFPALDLKVNIINHPATENPEAGWMALPLAIREPQFRLRTPGAISDPAKDLIEGGNFAFFWTQGGVSVCDPAGRGVGLCSPDAPALSLGEPGIYRFQGRWPAPKASVYVHLFNNKWNTNFRSFWNGGFSARVRLWPIAKFNPESDLVTPSEEVLAPMLTGLSNYKAGPLPPLNRGLSLSRKGVTLTAFGPNPDGEGTLLRLWELAGAGGDCTVTLPAAMKVESIQSHGFARTPHRRSVANSGRQNRAARKSVCPAELASQRWRIKTAMTRIRGIVRSLTLLFLASLPAWGQDDRIGSGNLVTNNRAACTWLPEGAAAASFAPDVDTFLKGLQGTMRLLSCQYAESKLAASQPFANGELATPFARWTGTVRAQRAPDDTSALNLTVTFKLNEGAATNAGVAVAFDFANWSTNNYVLIPAAVYNGNRYRTVDRAYATGLDPRDYYRKDLPLTQTAVPRLEWESGKPSKLEVSSCNAATPAICVFDRRARRGLIVLAEQAGRDAQGNFLRKPGTGELLDNAFAIEESADRTRATLVVSAPGVREFKPEFIGFSPSPDRGMALKAGDAIQLKLRVYSFATPDIPGLLEVFMAVRKSLTGPNHPRCLAPSSQVEKWMTERIDSRFHNTPTARFYCPENAPWIAFGWVGGWMNTFPMLVLGDEEHLERVTQTFDYGLKAQEPSGYFHYAIHANGSITFRDPGPDMNLARTSGDTLFWMVKQFQLLKAQGRARAIKPEWEASMRKLADAMAATWRSEGQWGKLINVKTGGVAEFNTTGGASIIGALALASDYFGNPGTSRSRGKPLISTSPAISSGWGTRPAVARISCRTPIPKRLPASWRR